MAAEMAGWQQRQTPSLGQVAQHMSPHPEVSEYMVRRLDGQALTALDASPDSGVTFNGLTGQWVAEGGRKNEM